MIVLDSNVLSELMRPRPEPVVVQWLVRQAATSLYVTSISYAEILVGIGLMPAGRRRQALAEQATAMFAEEFAGRILSFDAAAAPVYADIVAQRQRAGTRIAAEDGMIAAIARVRGASVATRDGDLTGCGVPVINPWSEG